MLRHLALSLAIVIAAPMAAETQIMSAPDAFAAVSQGNMVLIDIRSPEEWAETGVAQGAVTLTMHNKEFPKQISTLLNTQKDKTIGLICATGGRTNYVVSFLAKSGFPDVVDVSEGMMGNKRGAGWIARGLPLITSDAAKAAYKQLATNN